MGRALTLLGLQSTPVDPTDALDCMDRELRALLEEFPRSTMVVYPEFHTCRSTGSPTARAEQYEMLAEPLDGPRVTGLREVARRSRVWLVPGTVVERGSDGSLYNTAIAISPDGELKAAYRKMFPWRPLEPFRPGTEFVTFDVPGVGRIGLCICYDIWFPEVVRQLAWLGAELIVVPHHTPTVDREQELVLVRAAAIQNQVFVLDVNAAEPAGAGRSILADPEGLVRFQASSGPLLLNAAIDLDAVTHIRSYGTCGLNRMWSQFRPDDETVHLPLYDGRLDPVTWAPEQRGTL